MSLYVDRILQISISVCRGDVALSWMDYSAITLGFPLSYIKIAFGSEHDFFKRR